MTNSSTAPPPQTPTTSDDCTSPTATVADGFAGDTYVNIRVANPNSSTTWVCVQAANSAGNVGGKFVIDSSQAPQAPSVQNDPARCATEPGNLVPPPHPIDAELGDPNDPPHAVIELDSYTDGDEAWVCVHAAETGSNNDFGKRVVIPFPGTGAVNAVRFEPDTIPAPVPPPPPRPIIPSSTCEQGAGGTYQRVLNSGVGGEHVWLDAWRESDTRAHLCVRETGTANVGGRITLNTQGGGVSPVIIISDTDMTPCTAQVFQSDALNTEIRRSATGANPASLCVRQGTTQKRVTIGFTGSPTLGLVTWTPDTGTPIPPIP